MTINTDQQIYLLAEKKPNRAHANSNGHVLYYYSKSNTWIGSSYTFNPEGATHWMMLPDSPAPTKPPEELQDEAFNAWLKEKYVDVVIRTAMYPTLKEVFLLGVKHGGSND